MISRWKTKFQNFFLYIIAKKIWTYRTYLQLWVKSILSEHWMTTNSFFAQTFPVHLVFSFIIAFRYVFPLIFPLLLSRIFCIFCIYLIHFFVYFVVGNRTNTKKIYILLILVWLFPWMFSYLTHQHWPTWSVIYMIKTNQQESLFVFFMTILSPFSLFDDHAFSLVSKYLVVLS